MGMVVRLRERLQELEKVPTTTAVVIRADEENKLFIDDNFSHLKMVKHNPNLASAAFHAGRLKADGVGLTPMSKQVNE